MENIINKNKKLSKFLFITFDDKLKFLYESAAEIVESDIIKPYPNLTSGAFNQIIIPKKQIKESIKAFVSISIFFKIKYFNKIKINDKIDIIRQITNIDVSRKYDLNQAQYYKYFFF